ncbi:nucleotidyltransferase family protein [Brevibacterium casei]|uniref:RelA/SpoT domain-containing protein n=1 Tax=Brevibacterium casei TaxID=33889 RepID=A0A7T2WQ37_9MICO|nr:hypothetical protein [Brevibacterium casei]QPS34843.1 hypothetical protein I6G59_05910 [Brevibacterium casei]
MANPPRLKTPPWSQNDLRALGKALRDGTTPPGRAPDYEEVLAWYLDFSGDVLEHLEGLDWSPLGLAAAPGTSRPKTVGTLIEKLRRDRSTPLQNIGDLAGVRIDADMSLSVQTAFADSVAATIRDEVGDANVFIKDLRGGEHSGYRAVHVLTKYPAGRCEIQLRTQLQSAWANAYELLAMIVGREIRYGGMPSNAPGRSLVVSMLQESRTIAEFEGRLNLLSHLSHVSESVDEATRKILASKYNEDKKGEEPILRSLHDMEQRLLALVRGDRDD